MTPASGGEIEVNRVAVSTVRRDGCREPFVDTSFNATDAALQALVPECIRERLHRLIACDSKPPSVQLCV